MSKDGLANLCQSQPILANPSQFPPTAATQKPISANPRHPEPKFASFRHVSDSVLVVNSLKNLSF
jgi:hypothetical protein